MRDGLVDHKQMPRLFGLSSYGRGIRESTDLAILDGWSATLTLPDYVWVARHPPTIVQIA
jgi:uncharacterized membrane protein